MTLRYPTLRRFYQLHIFSRYALGPLKGCHKILDLGCGHNSLLIRSGLIHRVDVTGLDIYKPYAELHKVAGNYTEYISADITKMKFADGEFDAIFSSDVLEHIPKEDVLRCGLLENMKRWANRVVLIVPNGWVGNPVVADNPYMAHRSGWTTDELSEFGYQVRGLSGWKYLREETAELRFKFPYLFWAGLSVLSQGITYYIPEQSWHLLATYQKRR